MEEMPLETVPSLAPKKKINRRFIYLISGLLILILLFLGYKFLGSNKKAVISTHPATTTPAQIPTSTPFPSQSATPTESLTSTPSPKPSVNPVDSSTGLDRSLLSVTVENGSGEAGSAGAAADYLKGLGYDVTSTTNADNFNYTNVTIQIKSSESDYLPLLQKDLGFNYTIGSTSADLSDGFSSDALVIIGK